MAEKRYTVGSSQGWLNIKREPSGQIIAVPGFLQVQFTVAKDGRDYFTVLEGPEKGGTFSVKAGNLKPGVPSYKGPAKLEFSPTKQLLTYAGGIIKAITHPDNPVPLGMHPIQLPDFPHDIGAGYLAQTSYAMNWFYLGRGNALPGNNDRYLHAGRVSAGCITVEPTGWTKLYEYLILCRSNDAKTVGSVSVVR